MPRKIAFGLLLALCSVMLFSCSRQLQNLKPEFPVYRAKLYLEKYVPNDKNGRPFNEIVGWYVNDAGDQATVYYRYDQGSRDREPFILLNTDQGKRWAHLRQGYFWEFIE